MSLPQQTLGSTKFQCVCIRICCPFFGPSVFSIILFLYIYNHEHIRVHFVYNVQCIIMHMHVQVCV